ncbi:Gfo/Idh/MocA family oxidoreductase [Actinokineospora sp. NBRC 105648]|uniref:Gfo/Idh/MocA family protein n=1 Tax=Actinokineospora sp. NBRC 105648 TaxID=3032206 RepID=UPI0025552980|nr:Gfo/Idh/MocA family oxidoreductase [Actinokineospora sp. NBRC 105648]
MRVGVLGCADIARRRMLPALAAQPLVDLVAVASRDPDRAREFAEPYGCAPVHGYERLLDRADIDAVYIPLPTGMHAEWTLRALAAGKHVLCEKPCVTDPDEAARVAEAAGNHDLLVMESFMFLHHGQHRRVRALVEEGALGTLREITADFGIPATPRSAAAASSLLETGVYPLRLARLFAGEDPEVLGATLSVDAGTRSDVAGSVLLRFPSGVTARLGFGWRHSYRCVYELWGSAGRLVLDRAFTTPDDRAPVLRLERPDGVQEMTLPPERQFVNTAGAFAEAVLRGTGYDAYTGDIVRQAALVAEVRRAAFAFAPAKKFHAV